MKKILLAAMILFLTFLICFPIWVAITGTFSAQWELEQNLSPVFAGSEGMANWPLLPAAPTLKSLVEVLLDSPGFFTMFWNSVTISLFILSGQLLVDVSAAWALARFPLKTKKAILNLYIVLMLMPFQVLMFPQYLVLNDLGLLDTLGAVILPAVFSTFPVFILHRFFKAIPQEIIEAARLDGAGELRIFCQIGIPMGAPGILSVCILTFLDSWNMIEQPMTYLKTKSLWPLSLFLPEIGMAEMGLGFAAALMMLIPALLLFLGCQEYLEQGIAMSGGKD
ncbi:MAG: carbohydrate ABC transporter permease [Oscillospiraceae bacterium]|nr:carbohydrate ABC transporter permease [Oscillospiraceae bacterium]